MLDNVFDPEREPRPNFTMVLFNGAAVKAYATRKEAEDWVRENTINGHPINGGPDSQYIILETLKIKLL